MTHIGLQEMFKGKGYLEGDRDPCDLDAVEGDVKLKCTKELSMKASRDLEKLVSPFLKSLKKTG